MPKTPPDSPAEFHYSLPSPGLASPLALFGALAADDSARAKRVVRVERVDFRAIAAAKPKVEVELDIEGKDSKETRSTQHEATPAFERPSITVSPAPATRRTRPGHARQRSIPSLEQITERYAQTPAPAPAVVSQEPAPVQAPVPSGSRLPAFLVARRQTPSPPPAETATSVATPVAAEKTRPRLARMGRIPTPPSEAPSAVPIAASIPFPSTPTSTTTQPQPQPPSPCPRARSRTSTARDMLCAVRRRTVLYGFPAPVSPREWAMLKPCGGGAQDGRFAVNPKRISAPAELGVRRPRTGFAHPVLALPGGF